MPVSVPTPGRSPFPASASVAPRGPAVSIRSSSACRSGRVPAPPALTPLRQVSIRNAMTTASSSGNQPPSRNLVEFAAKKMQSITKKKPLTGITTASGLIAPLQRDQRRQQRGDRHQQRHRDAVGAGQRLRGAEADHRAEGRRRQQPVHQRHVDLTASNGWWCARYACAAGSRAGSPAASTRTRRR